MSLALGLTLAIGSLLLVGAGLVWMVVWLRRDYDAHEQEALGLLREECARRGWTYEERNDSYADWYNALPLIPHLGFRDPLNPAFTARGAREVITGEHRGRPFLAATFEVFQFHQAMSNPQTCIWVQMPAARPGLVVKKVIGPQNAINRALGWDYQKFGDPEFDQRFEVTSDDDRFAHDVLHPRMMRFLLDERRPFQEFWMVGDIIDTTGTGVAEHREPRQLVPALDLRCDILDLVPQMVWAR